MRGGPAQQVRRHSTVAGAALLAALAYVPTVLTARGVVPGDTKLYLYLDPARLIGDAASLWDARQFGGWVTHQTVGYLWPTGPWYWLFEQLGAPDWLAQRLWLGTLFFAAGTGMWWCARRLGLGTPAALVAALAFQLSPYVLPYVSRTSALLLPWAGLGWLVGLTMRATRRAGWRDVALAGLVVATVGGLNATALAMVAPAPALWLLHAGTSGEVPWRRVGVTAAKLLGVCAAVSAWWLVPLAVQSRFGADVLAYSETIEAVATTSLASEVLRGLGYWLFYGGNVVIGNWTGSSTAYVQSPLLMGLGFAIVAGGFAGLVLARWRHRAFAVACIVVGVVLAVGAHPTDDPSPLGSLLADSSRSTVVLALRSSTRAVPLVVFGLALGLGAAVAALGRIDRRAGLAAAGATGLVAVAALPPLWTGGLIDPVLRRPEDLPAWWTDAAAALDADPEGGRVLELPGTEFAVHRWGDTVDPILPGLIDRPTIARDLLPLGSPAVMDLLYALDDRFQDGAVEPGMIAPVARLLGATDVLHRGDVAYERFQGPRPEETWALYAGGVPGLGEPRTFGAPMPNVGPGMLDETTLSNDASGTPIPPLALVPVENPVPVVRATSDDRRVVLVGSGAGVVDAAAAGVIDGRELLRYAASAPDAAALAEWTAGAALVLTDSNRREARQWRGSQETRGYTESDTTAPLVDDPADHRLPVFDDSAVGRTVARQEGGLVARASAYGSPVSYRPEARAWHAVDGDPQTAWLVGDRGPIVGERLRVDLPQAGAPASVTLVQPAAAADPVTDRAITAVRVRTEAGELDAVLDVSSRTPTGQTIPLPPGQTSWVELEIRGDSAGDRDTFFRVGPAGFAEVRVDGVNGPTDEVVELPVVPDATGGDGPLAVVLTRWRVDARKRWRNDPEASLVRRITLPRSADFALRGTARLSPRATDDVLAAAIGLDGDGPVTATGSGRMAGVRTAWGRAALDGDPSTAWTSPFGLPVGTSITVTLANDDESMDRLVPRVVEDDRHSVPTELTISTATEERVVPLPPGGGPVTFPALTGGTFTFTVTAADVRTTVERRTEEPVDLPVAISELGLGDLTVTPLPTELDTGCRDDLLTIDGVPALVRVTGTVQDALAGAPLALAWCGPAPGPSLTAGTHELRSAAGTATGIDVDQVVLTDGTLPLSPGDAPELRASVLGDGPTSTDVTVDGDGGFWLISGQGHNDGWRASWAGRDLGDPQLVDGGMNGWWVPRSGSETVQVELRWEPQRVVRWGLLAGLVAVGACAALAIRPRRGDAAPRDEPTDEPEAIRRPLAAAPPLSLGPGVTVVAVTALFAWFVIGGWWALTAAVVTGIAAFARHGRRLAGLAAAAIVVGVGVYYVLHQVRVRPLEGFGWVTNVEVMHRPALLAVVLLGADSAIGILAARRDRRYRPLPSRE